MQAQALQVLTADGALLKQYPVLLKLQIILQHHLLQLRDRDVTPSVRQSQQETKEI